jgi:hypothetical protein
MPVKSFLRKMDERREILKKVSRSPERRRKLKKAISLKIRNSRNHKIFKGKNFGLRENYKLVRRAENAFGVALHRKSYKNVL